MAMYMKTKPCPFCGGENIKIVTDHEYQDDTHCDRVKRIACDDCDIRGPQGLDEKGAIWAWNDRPDAQ